MNTYKTTSVFGSFVFSKILLPALGSSLVAIQVGCAGIRNDARATRGGGASRKCSADERRNVSDSHNTGKFNLSRGISRDIPYMDNNNDRFTRSLSDEGYYNQREHNANS